MDQYIHPDILAIKTEILDWEEKLIHELEITIKQNERMYKSRDVEESFKQKIQSLSYDLKIYIVQITTKLVSFREDIQLYTRKEIEGKKQELFDEYQACLKKLKNLQYSTQKFRDLEKTQKPEIKKKLNYEQELHKLEQNKVSKERRKSKECNLYKIYDQQDPLQKPPSPSFNQQRNRSSSPYKFQQEVQELKSKAQQVRQSSQNHLHSNYGIYFISEEEISRLQEENKTLKNKINVLYEEHSQLKNSIEFIKQKCDYLENENTNLYDLIQAYLQTNEQAPAQKSNPSTFRSQTQQKSVYEKMDSRGISVQELKNQKSEKQSTPKQRFLIPQNKSFESDQNYNSEKDQEQDICTTPGQFQKYLIPRQDSIERKQESNFQNTPKKVNQFQLNNLEQNDHFTSNKKRESPYKSEPQSAGKERFLLPQKKIDTTQFFIFQ